MADPYSVDAINNPIQSNSERKLCGVSKMYKKKKINIYFIIIMNPGNILYDTQE